MSNLNDKILKYADLIVTKGINVQKGQPVLINGPIDRADFIRILSKKCYEKGASEVIVNWSDDELALLKYINAPLEVFEEYPNWAVEKLKYYYDKNAAVISISSSNPELLKDIDPIKIATSNKSASIAQKSNRKYTMNDINSWCVVSAPTVGWATKVFPDLSDEDAVAKLWDAILFSTRANKEDPVFEWDKHVAEMDRHAAFLNEKQFIELYYENSKGTNLTVELPKGHIWLSAGSKNAKGAEFIANIPTEEVFTLPKRDGVNGILYSTKPLNYGGNLIDEMKFIFKDGKVIEYDAKIGKQYLDDMFAVDEENGKYLGEVALVPYNSPISNLNILFLNTLFDENASCHFAFGKAYPTCLENGANMSDEELLNNGVNDSLIHVDFMIGSEDLSIMGITKDREKVKIFEKGNWAF